MLSLGRVLPKTQANLAFIHFLFLFLFLFFPVLCPVVRALPKTQTHVAEAADRL
jgi:hypothetical protein